MTTNDFTESLLARLVKKTFDLPVTQKPLVSLHLVGQDWTTSLLSDRESSWFSDVSPFRGEIGHIYGFRIIVSDYVEPKETRKLKTSKDPYYHSFRRGRR